MPPDPTPTPAVPAEAVPLPGTASLPADMLPADMPAGLLADMLAVAGAARANAHAPYSGFTVGACLLGDSGRLHAGANVENAAYPQGQCAEASALGALVTAGDRRLRALVLVAGGPVACPPCGGCRQRLAEFAGPELPVVLADPAGQVRMTLTLGALLPYGFGPENLA